ncbi:hypothetical protein IQ06DRAFT_286556 [Phaeosphaeriaceae sp. SRC1lsM3a]|nr:hypothetical protein IQ06DRAFT_286556 [Stagonospora sp. SRC1lsM3a]
MVAPYSTQKARSTDGTKLSSRGALLISPQPLSSLSDTTCPICRDSYVNMPTPGQKVSPDREFAVSIDMVAEWHGSKRLCGHVLGRKCFEKHLKSKGAWRNRCPLCRDVWFRGDDVDEREDDEAVQDDESTTPEQPTMRPRRSARISARTNSGRNTSLQPMSANNGVNRTHHTQRGSRRPRHCTQQLLAALEVCANGDEVTGTMDDVERRLHTLYKEMER